MRGILDAGRVPAGAPDAARSQKDIGRIGRVRKPLPVAPLHA
jgi:hypothetical protein